MSFMLFKCFPIYSLFSLILGDVNRFYFLKYNCKARPFSYPFFLLLLSPRLYPNYIYRLSHFFYLIRFRLFAFLFCRLNMFLFGIEIAPACDIGPGLFLPHTYGTVLGAIRIGHSATIFQGVTVGCKSISFDYSSISRPLISDCVTLGTGCVVLGGISIGSNSLIAANSLVTSDLPSYTYAYGNPFKSKSIIPSSN